MVYFNDKNIQFYEFIVVQIYRIGLKFGYGLTNKEKYYEDLVMRDYGDYIVGVNNLKYNRLIEKSNYRGTIIGPGRYCE